MNTKTKIPFIKVSYERTQDTGPQLSRSEDVYQYCLQISDMDVIDLYEQFICIYLDRRNRVIGIRELNTGTVSCTVVNVSLLFAIAIQSNCSSIILAHNHPSGNVKPSDQDNKLTERICQIAKLFSIQVLDHLVISKDHYYSYSDEGELNWI